MDELARAATSLGATIDPDWSDEDVAERLSRFHHRAARRRRRRQMSAVAALGIVAALAVWTGRDSRRDTAVREPDAGVAMEPTRPALRFADGARAWPLDAATEVVAVEVSDHTTTVQLAEGAARFEAGADPARGFRVEAGEYAIARIVGDGRADAVFTVSHQHHRLLVDVERGAVRVMWRGDIAVLSAGERREFSPAVPNDAGPGRSAQPQPDDRASAPSTPRQVAPKDAPRSPQPARAAPAAPSVDELLRDADVARLSDRPADAARLLRRALAMGPDPSREAIAAFTLGRVLLDRLARPDEAAEAFARAHAAQPTGPLAADALAREVEAWSGAGAAELARRRARAFVERFPDNRRRRQVEQRGGL